MKEGELRPSGIGGQAVMEGIMMKNAENYSVAVRKPDGEIAVCVKQYKSFRDKCKLCDLPLIRGVFAFIDSLILGMTSLNYSADFYLEDDEEEKRKKEEREKAGKKSLSERLFGDKAMDVLMAVTVVISIVISVALFMMLPLFLAELCEKYIPFIGSSQVPVIEGIVKMLLFVGYLLLISLMKDIQRTFMYHGAEHKCINCIEHGYALNVENVRKSSRLHKRCGTSFMFLVMIISIIFFIFIQVDNRVLRYVIRLLLIPVVAGVSYEFIRLAGRTENKIVAALSKPGLCMQYITTKEPDDSMIEVAIRAIEEVFDWKKYQEEAEQEETPT